MRKWRTYFFASFFITFNVLSFQKEGKKTIGITKQEIPKYGIKRVRTSVTLNYSKHKARFIASTMLYLKRDVIMEAKHSRRRVSCCRGIKHLLKLLASVQNW